MISKTPDLLRDTMQKELGLYVDVYDELGNLMSVACEGDEDVRSNRARDINVLKTGGGSIIPVYEEDEIKYFLDCGSEISAETRNMAEIVARVVIGMQQNATSFRNAFRKETDLVTRMISKTAGIYHHDIVAFGASAGYKLEHPMLMIVTSLETNYNYCLNMSLGYESATNDAKVSIIKQLKEHRYMNKQDIVAFVENNRLVLLKAVEELNDTRKMYTIIQKLSEMISDVLKSYRIFKYYIAPGEIIQTFDVAHQTYEESLEYIWLSQQMNLDHPIITRDDVFYYALISKLPNEYRLDVIGPKVQKLLALDTEVVENMIQCFEVYINNGFNIHNTADMVYLHRNTIRKRFEKLHQITGFDPTGDFKSILMNKLILQEYLIVSRGGRR